MFFKSRNIEINMSYKLMNFNEILKKKIIQSYGAISIFIGTTKCTNSKFNVKKIDYEIFGKMLYKILINKFNLLLSNFFNIYIYQYIGIVSTSNINLFIYTSTFNRRNSILLCNYIIKLIKCYTPIWKKEYFDNFKYNWINYL